MGRIEIACPSCDWLPEKEAFWQCDCGHLWNTFATGGVCPECEKRWKDTQCPRCREWSPHIDWYKGLDETIHEDLGI